MGPQKLRKYTELFANKLAINEKRVLYSILNSEERLNDLKAYLQDYFEGDLKNKRVENLKSLIKNKKNFSERVKNCFSKGYQYKPYKTYMCKGPNGDWKMPFTGCKNKAEAISKFEESYGTKPLECYELDKAPQEAKDVYDRVKDSL